MSGSLRVIASGPYACLQDLGRPGYAGLGVGRSGAADRGALRLANRLVGNDEGAAGIEVLLGGLVVRAHEPVLVAVTGALGPVTVAGRPVGMNAATPVPAGATVQVAPGLAGVRRYVAVRGGIAADPVLGSRSTDTLAGLGPAALQAGALLPIGHPTQPVPDVDVAGVAAPATGEVVLEMLPGPRADWFADPVPTARYTVSSDSDRVAVRLSGPALRRTRTAELPSEGLVSGAVQVPADGQPLIFLADHPVTGGYPVVGVLTDHSIDLAAQLRPGQPVRFSAAGRKPWRWRM